jgi:glycosyltransferase involved in cell wall biosynthesis
MENLVCVPLVSSPSLQRSVTLVIPAFNEADNLEKLMLFIEQSFQNLGFSFPVILIDDGSTDGTWEILKKVQEKYKFLKVVRHGDRQGVAKVWKTALACVKTEWIMWGQADLETDPRTDIPLLLSACQPGVDAVAGWRQNRKDGKLLASQIANWINCQVFGLKIHDMNWIKLVRRDLLSEELLNWTTHRYLLAALAGLGYNIAEVKTPWHPRNSGKTKFGKGRLISASVDFIKLIGWWSVIKLFKLSQPKQDLREASISRVR